MAQLNKERLRYALLSQKNTKFKKRLDKFRRAVQAEKKIIDKNPKLCSRLKQDMLYSWSEYAAMEGKSEEETRGVCIILAAMDDDGVLELRETARMGGFVDLEDALRLLLEGSRGLVAARDSALDSVLESGEQLQVELVKRCTGSRDVFCEWAQDQDLHIELIDQASESCAQLMEAAWANYMLGEEEVRGVAEASSEMLKIYADLQKMAAHTYIATQGLGIEFPTKMKQSMETGILSSAWEQLTPEKYEDCIWRISFIPPEKIAKELLKMLFPRKWRKIFEGCMTGPSKVSAPPKKPSLPPEHIALAKRLVKEYPEDSFSDEQVTILGGACGWDEGKVVSVVELGYYGIEREDAVFLVNEGLDDRIVGKHTLVASILESEKISHQDVHHALRVLSEDSCWDMMEKLPDYLGWMEVMAGRWDANEKQELSAVLALAARPPANRAGVHAILRENADKILDQIIELEPGSEQVEKNFFDYFRYSGRFVKERAAAGKESAAEVERAPERRVERPHESLNFSDEVENYIESKGVLVENAKRALIYGLRLSSRKSAIGGKYFPITAFRQNVRVVLSRESGNPEERVKVVEEFLYKEGVISRYKQGDVVKLNLKDEIGQHNDPSEIGQQILDSVISWKVEFDRRTTINGNGS